VIPAAACPPQFEPQVKADADACDARFMARLEQQESYMSVLKSLTLAAAVVLGMATLANAATYHYRYYNNQAAANTATAEHFQNEFKNTY
jgi:hypothetical protein